MDKVLFSHNSDHWATPKDLYWYYCEEWGYFDPCPLYADFDGLAIDWPKYVFVNPPFSNILPFVEKAIRSWWNDGKTHILLLLPVRTDTKWFRRLCDFGCNIYFFPKRLHFNESKNPAPFPCMLVEIDGSCSCMDDYHQNKFSVFWRLDDIHEQYLKHLESLDHAG